MIAPFAKRVALEAAEHQRGIDNTEPVSLTRVEAGHLIAALAQAVRCVSLNHAVIGSGRFDEEWDAIGVLDDATHALTSIGMIMAKTPDEPVLTLESEIVVWAARALGQVIKKLSAGTWDLKPMKTDVNKFIATMTEDALLLGGVTLG